MRWRVYTLGLFFGKPVIKGKAGNLIREITVPCTRRHPSLSGDGRFIASGGVESAVRLWGMFWHFVGVIWGALYVAVYLI